ncbi:hypothetical protein N7540_010102 [Penicillium herquei]|nr:hypothetical protein N7540_010102 [Penicillium herquei]
MAAPPDALKWGIPEEIDGRKYQFWIDGLYPGAICPVQPCELNFDELYIEETTLDDDLSRDPVTGNVLPEIHLEMFRNFGVADYTTDRGRRVMSYDKPAYVLPGAIEAMQAGQYKQIFALGWAGCVADQMIILEYLQHNKDRPYMSDVTNAIYHNFYPDKDPDYVFVSYIINDEFIDVLNFQIYTIVNGYDKSAPGGIDTLAWAHNTPEYMVLLGTPIGKVVAAFILGRYPPGVMRIASITIHIREVAFGNIDVADAMFTLKPTNQVADPPAIEEEEDRGKGKRKRDEAEEDSGMDAIGETEDELDAGPVPPGGPAVVAGLAPKVAGPAPKRPRLLGRGSRRRAIADRATAIRMSLPRRKTRSGKDYNPDA